MKLIKPFFVILLFLVFISGCSSNLKEGTYYGVNSTLGEVDLTITPQNIAILQFKRNGIKNSGAINKKKKEITFSERKKYTATYKLENGNISITDEDGTTTYYANKGKEYKEALKKVNLSKATNIEDSNSSYNEVDSESLRNSNSVQTETISINEVVEKIKNDYLNSIIGTWVAVPSEAFASLPDAESIVEIKPDQTFNATYIYGNQTNLVYTGNFIFVNTNNLKSEIERMVDYEIVSSVDEIDTYEKYSKITGQNNSYMKLDFTISTVGVRFEKEIEKLNETKTVNLELFNDQLSFQNVLGIIGDILYYEKQ